MLIIVKTLDIGKYKVNVDEDDTVMMILVKLQEFIEELNPKKHYFVYKRQPIKFHKTLKECGFVDKTSIYIFPSIRIREEDLQELFFYDSEDNDEY